MLGIRNRVERSSRATRVLLREKARVASIFVRTDGEATSDEKTSKERMHLDLEADDVRTEVRRLEALGATRWDHQAERGRGRGRRRRVRKGPPGETSRSTGTGAADLRQVISCRWSARLSGEGRLTGPRPGRESSLAATVAPSACGRPGSPRLPGQNRGGPVSRGNTPAPARRPGGGTGAERGLDGVGDELGGLGVDGDVPAEQHAADDLPGVPGARPAGRRPCQSSFLR